MNGLKFSEDDEEPELLSTLTPGSSQQMSAPLPNPAQVRPLPPVSTPTMSMAQKAAPAPSVAPTQQSPMALPGMPAMAPDEIDSYFSKQKENLNRFGPEEQLDLQNRLAANRGSLRYRAADAGTGFADALMMGVARAGNPGFNQAFKNQQNLQGQEAMDALRGAEQSNIRRTEGGMSIDKMDPGSDLSKTSQKTYGPLFEKLGYDPSALSKMSAANIDNALALMAQYGGKEMEAIIQRYQADMNLGETQRHNMEMEDLGRAGQEEAARKLSVEHPIASGLHSMLNGKTPNDNAGVPSVGGTFNGEKVVSVRRIN